MTLIISAVLHLGVVTALIVLPLIFYNSLSDFKVITFLFHPPDAPPPPPPPLPRQALSAQPKTIVAQYTVPTELPRSIPPPDTDAPVIDKTLVNSINLGLPGGVPGGSALGIVGGIVGKQLPLPPLPKPVDVPPPNLAKASMEPIFVGGDIQAAKLIYKKPATYPHLAAKMRVSGVVLLQITVDEEGKVSDIKVISGHPLLAPAAVDAVRYWKYSPTFLNGQPVQVIADVEVTFAL
jgi:protein TonB